MVFGFWDIWIKEARITRSKSTSLSQDHQKVFYEVVKKI